MKALVVSRLSLGNAYEKLRKFGITEFVDYYEKHDGWKTEDDIIKAIESEKCDTVVIVSNFWLALRILAKSNVKSVFVVQPIIANVHEILKARIYQIIAENVTVIEHES